jgi:hypothetical protein
VFYLRVECTTIYNGNLFGESSGSTKNRVSFLVQENKRAFLELGKFEGWNNFYFVLKSRIVVN